MKDLTLNKIRDSCCKWSKKEALRKIIHRYLTSENLEDSVDRGLSVYNYKAVAGNRLRTLMLDAMYEERKKLESLREITQGRGS